MLYQIALSVALLIFAFTTLPKLSSGPEKPAAREQTVEPRPIKLEAPQAIDVRVVVDPPSRKRNAKSTCSPSSRFRPA